MSLENPISTGKAVHRTLASQGLQVMGAMAVGTGTPFLQFLRHTTLAPKPPSAEVDTTNLTPDRVEALV